MPLSALFILFDFVVQNPDHPDTRQNISLIGVAAGYFCQLEHASDGFIPGSVLYGFFDIAQQHVSCHKEAEECDRSGIPRDRPPEATLSSHYSSETQRAPHVGQIVPTFADWYSDP